VKIEILISKPFLISSGVRQDDPLSATLFNLILDSVIKKINLRGNVSLKLTQIFAYADDVAPLARYLKALKEIFHNLQYEATLVGLNINKKTQIYENKKKENKRYNTLKKLIIYFENVKNFNYLGSTLNADNKINIRNCRKNSKKQHSTLCQFKTSKIKTLKEIH
jgi:hypothetical protein